MTWEELFTVTVYECKLSTQEMRLTASKWNIGTMKNTRCFLPFQLDAVSSGM